jgi:hypothetical protein
MNCSSRRAVPVSIRTADRPNPPRRSGHVLGTTGTHVAYCYRKATVIEEFMNFKDRCLQILLFFSHPGAIAVNMSKSDLQIGGFHAIIHSGHLHTQ